MICALQIFIEHKLDLEQGSSRARASRAQVSTRASSQAQVFTRASSRAECLARLEPFEWHVLESSGTSARSPLDSLDSWPTLQLIPFVNTSNAIANGH